MYRLMEQGGRLKVDDYPVGVAAVAAGFLVAVAGGAVAGVVGDTTGLVLGAGVPLLFLAAVLQRRVTVFDPAGGQVCQESGGLLLRRDGGRHPVADIRAVDIVRGRGRFAHAPALGLVLGDGAGRRILIVADADVLPGHARRIRRLKECIEGWLAGCGGRHSVR